MFYHRKLPRVLLAITALSFLLVTTAFTKTSFTGSETAYANTPGPGGSGPDYRVIYFNMTTRPGPTLRARYNQMLDNLRHAVGHLYRGRRLAITQSGTHGLVFINVTLPNSHNVELIISPEDLYLQGYIVGGRGFLVQGEQTPEVNDPANNNIRRRLIDRFTTPTTVVNLPFTAHYTSLRRSSDLAQNEETRVSYQSVIDALNTLSSTTTSPNGQTVENAQIGRSLLVLIQWSSEAARYYRIQEVGQGAMGSLSGGENINGTLLALETSWGPFSDFARDVTANSTIPPRVVNGVTLRNIHDLETDRAAGVAIVRSRHVRNDGSFAHTEL